MDSSLFPIFFDDHNPLISLTDSQKKCKEDIIQALSEKSLVLIENKCICGNTSCSDIVVSEKDRFGIPIPQLLCLNCGLIRSQFIFDNNSNNIFYTNYYRKLYNTSNIEDYFQYQTRRGSRFLTLLKSLNLIAVIESIAEIGCGSGGILYPFLGKAKEIKGYDFENFFLEFGKTRGLNLSNEDFFSVNKDNSLDLIIMSHLVEHLVEPLAFLKRVISKIKPGKYLLIEVPGLYSNPFPGFNPILFFQNAHVIQFYTKAHLTVLLKAMGLTIIYGDETCTFVCQKESTNKEDVGQFFQHNWGNIPEKIHAFLKKCKKEYYQSQKVGIRQKIYRLACMFKYEQIKTYICKIFKRGGND